MTDRNVRQRLLRDPNDPPPGWIDCPAMGDVVGGFMVPMKTPLDGKFRTGGEQWSPHDVMEAFSARSLSLCMVMDLNNSTRYYRPDDFERHQVMYCKVACKGRGQSPEPAAVNEAVFQLTQFYLHQPQDRPHPVVAIHCTHGFNRTGYITICTMVRLMAKSGMTVLRGLRAFTAARPPGIYKHDYITDLFTYHHEQDRRQEWPTPPLPEWKEDDGDDDDPHASAKDAPREAEGKVPAHDDVIGEAIPAKEEETLRQLVYEQLHLFDHRSDEWTRRFPGSQPVSLERRNMHQLNLRRYYATWKADGTRYMLLLNHMGTYLINRNWSFRRVQMRFPTRLHHKDKRRPPPYPVGEPHILTLLDGEMVVDHVKGPDGQESWSRRFLAYDLMLCAGRNVLQEPFKARYELIESEVVAPRVLERGLIQANRANPRVHPTIYKYRYESELFSVRRKEFWPLYRARKLIEDFIPQLCHEADGLIFQGYEEPYVVGTCHELLKYKFPHLNSVDFLLRLRPAGLQLLLMDRRAGPRSGNTPGLRALPDARLRFPEGVEAEAYADRIVECTWDFAAEEWLFLRERTDKSTPNAWRVYESVWQSIQDNITDQELLSHLDRCVHMPPYHSDLLKAIKDKRPLPPLPDDMQPYPGHPEYTGPPVPGPPAYPYNTHMPPGPPGHYPPNDPYHPHPEGGYPPAHYPPGPPHPHPHHQRAYPPPPHIHGHPMDAPYPHPHGAHPGEHHNGHQRHAPYPGGDPAGPSGGGGRAEVFTRRLRQPKVFRPNVPESPPYFPHGPFPYLQPSQGADDDNSPPPSPPAHPGHGAPDEAPGSAAGGVEGEQGGGGGEGGESPRGLAAVPMVALEGLDASLNPAYVQA